ncbi:Glyoxalase/Bleomycin resistance protein/Dihydroxybiphenyl dioxygenase [Aspergillus lucknowensis]|uniref:Glyoxalase/Bleomycin resistance protein/Dihydroxybiphenyl dioxygenase n=1 Tax=Aspergillus lucknowensis TaxID=176173 RepID=A0ABR4LLL5_9EURO
MASERTFQRPLNHVAVSVADISAVVPWYTRLFGFQLIGQISHIKRADTPDAGIFSIYPPELNEVKIAYMSTGNGVGFEVFEFVDPPAQAPTTPLSGSQFEYTRAGFFHVCVTDPDPEARAQKVVEAGGRRLGKMVKLAGGTECLYVADPWGNVVEILDTSFERLASAFAAMEELPMSSR